jgi:hypothetical protein
MDGTIYQINIKSEIPGEQGLSKIPIESVMVFNTGVEGDFN